MTGSKTGRVEVPGATLWTASSGAGVPMILAHGGPGLSDNLAPLAEMLDDLAVLHRCDQRGSGRSRSDGPFDVPSFVADIEALRQHLGHQRWVVGGHSWGANLALLYALAHPEHTLGVMYLAGSGLTPGFRDDVRDTRHARLTDDERAELAQLVPKLPDGDPNITDRFLRLMWITDFAARETANQILDEQPLYQFPRNEEVFRAVMQSFDAIADGGLEDQVRQLPVPVIVIHGAHDVPARALPVARAAPRGQWVQLEHSAHVPWLEEPPVLREVLQGFIEQLN
jgi:proline iminopeptidase